MSRWILAIALAVVPVAAQNIGGSRTGEHQQGNRIVLTSRGEAHRSERRVSASPWELRKSFADDAGILQPVVEELDRDSSTSAAAKANKPKEFVQLVNGSTPTGWMEMGTPPKYLLVIFDTGSDKLVAKTWDTVSSELSSVDQGIQGMVQPSALIY